MHRWHLNDTDLDTALVPCATRASPVAAGTARLLFQPSVRCTWLCVCRCWRRSVSSAARQISDSLQI
jgi:hypothetical protein